ncbi:MAG: hypothetical protein OEY30_04290 [Candidatus Bathyarchaeota archaeon]|nr:hypothetical protein [Candidatus Bathyarchaeota archaeon]
MRRKERKKGRTMDVYDDEQREEMLKADEVTVAESAFMAGRDRKVAEKAKEIWLEEKKKEAKGVKLARKKRR